MKFSTLLLRTVFAPRLFTLDKVRRHPIEVQSEQLDGLLSNNSSAPYLRSFGMTEMSSYEDFRRAVPIVQYEDFHPWIERVIGGERTALTAEPAKWLARSSGTTNDRSKFIPINRPSLDGCHYRGGRDVMAVFAHNFPNSKAFEGKSLTLGGTQQIIDGVDGLKAGDLSAILIDNAPSWVSTVRLPHRDVALIADFEQKVQKICETCSSHNVTSFAGVPSWNLVLMNKILEYNGKNSLLDVWPNMSLFIHGGMAFTPYLEQYRRILPTDQMAYMETYNASEGFFAFQDDPSDDAMLLMLDYGTFYEFLAMNHLNDHSKAVPLEDVKCGVNYAMIISTAGGLWRYMIGDTVQFTSTDPYKIKITGRTKHFINAFGEELIVDNAERGLAAACKATGATVREYTVAPIFMGNDAKGAHEWVVEFDKIPKDLKLFGDALDRALVECNSDYGAKRSGNATMARLKLSVVDKGTFYRWMGARGKAGGQNKVPRLSSKRDYVEQLLAL